MTDNSRILSDDESYQRRSQQASSVGPRIVTLCAATNCPRAAANGPWCLEHRRPDPGPSQVIARDLTTDELAVLTTQVEADAAPLFVLAMSWIARQHVAHLGVSLESIEASMQRIQAELSAGDPQP